MVDVQLRGYKFKVRPAEVIKLARNLPPSKGRKYATVVDGRAFSPKEIVAHLIEAKNIPLTKLDFTTMDAARILRRLGFETRDLASDKRQKKSLLSFAGIVSLGGDSLKEGEAWHE